jgi:preprotein translocase subunit SecY
MEVAKMAIAAMIVGGILSLAIAVFHLRLPSLLRWPEPFNDLPAGQGRIIATLNAALTFLFLTIGIITLVYAGELATATGLAGGLTIALAVFWLWRLVWQLSVFSPRSDDSGMLRSVFLWLTAAFAVLTVCYALPVILKLTA